MTAPLTGYTSTFPTDVLLDSGVLYLNTAVLGVFQGGLKFDPGATYRNIDFDGKRSPVYALDRKTAMAPKLSGTMIELGTDHVPVLEPGATTVVSGAWTASTSYQPLAANDLLVSGDYISEVRAIWQRGNGGYVQVRFPIGIITKYDITSQDGAEVAIALEIEARLDMTVSGTTTGTAPYRIEYIAAV